MYILQTSKYFMNAIKTCVFIENMQKRNFYFRYVKIKIKIVLTTQNESIKKIQDASNNKAMIFGKIVYIEHIDIIKRRNKV